MSSVVSDRPAIAQVQRCCPHLFLLDQDARVLSVVRACKVIEPKALPFTGLRLFPAVWQLITLQPVQSADYVIQRAQDRLYRGLRGVKRARLR